MGSVAALSAALLVCGCGSSGAANLAERTQFEKKVGADEGKARQFLGALESQPANARADYVRAHPDDMRNMALIPDQDMQVHFKKLMLGRG